MTIANNLTRVSNRQDLTSEANQFFNNYFQPNFNISQDLNTAILSVFEKITLNAESAKILASSVVYTSMVQKVPVMQVVDRLRSMTVDESANYLSLFLNLNRVGTSFVGVHNRPKIGKYVQRSILP